MRKGVCGIYDYEFSWGQFMFENLLKLPADFLTGPSGIVMDFFTRLEESTE